MCMQQFLYPFTSWWTWRLFLAFSYCKETCDVHLCPSLCTDINFHLSSVEWLDFTVAVHLKKLPNCFSEVVLPFYAPTSSVWEFPFLHVLANLQHGRSFHRCVVVSYRGFQIANDDCLPVSLYRLSIFLGEMSLQIPRPFFIGLLVFFIES